MRDLTHEPADVVAALSDHDQPAVLWGVWFGGGVIIMRAPVRAQPLSTAAEVAAMIDKWPADLGSGPVGDADATPRTQCQFDDHR